MATRHVKAAPRGKPSGLPFHCQVQRRFMPPRASNVSVSGHATRADYVIEAMGCGCAFLDYDNDGWLDILVLSSSRFGDPPPNASNRLYKNNRDGTFTDVTRRRACSGQVTHFGITVGDYNNDGFEDLFITGWPQNILYRNNGNGTFTDITESSWPDERRTEVRHWVHVC